jgi:hypothetical protein
MGATAAQMLNASAATNLILFMLEASRSRGISFMCAGGKDH